MNVNHFSIDDCSPPGINSIMQSLPPPADRHLAIMSGPAQTSPSTRWITASRCVAQPCGILCHHVQHRLNIRRRAGDDAQDFARRRLLLQRFFEFLEQPHVLDGDHSLIGEGFDQVDLSRQ